MRCVTLICPNFHDNKGDFGLKWIRHEIAGVFVHRYLFHLSRALFKQGHRAMFIWKQMET